jgi:3-oxoacyl-[acyl-carrier protein] reductase
MDLGLRGRQALLSGASRGLGHACAFALAREGVDVTIVARKREALEKAGAEIAAATGVKVTTVAADITTGAGRAAALAACPEPDILLNNADGPAPGDFRDWSRDERIAALDAMMLSPIEMMRLTVDGMMTRGFGRIINIVSRSVKMAQLELGLSNGARSGLVGFVAGLARQTIARNVTINNLLCRESSTATRSAPTLAQCWRQPARPSRSCGARAPRRTQPAATVGRTSSAPIARFFAPNMPASSPAKIC